MVEEYPVFNLRQPWECPRCNTINSPYKDSCSCHLNISGGTGTINEDHPAVKPDATALSDANTHNMYGEKRMYI